MATHARYEAPPSIPQRLRPDQIPTETPLIVPVIEDNPRMWHRDQFGVECLTGTFPIRSEPITQHFNNRKINTAWDFYVRHEEVIRVGREKWTRVRNSSRVEHHEAAFRAAYQDLFDPTKFSLPEDIFTSALPQSHVDLSSLKAVVRTGKSHSEDLLDFVRSARSRRTRPPRGFLIQPGQIGSLPRWFDRRPGDSLEESEGILGAFSDRHDQLNQVQRRPPGTTHSFGQQRPLRGTWGDIDVTVRRGHWNYEHEQQELRAALEADLQREVTDGPLSEYQEENLFDTEGRQHNRNITSQGVENWQVYSQYDIANPRSEGRTPFRMLSRLRNLLNDNKWNFSEPAVAQTGTAQPNPGAQAPAPAQGGGDGPTTAQPSGAGAAPAANTQGANQGQGNNGNGGDGAGVAQGVKSQGLQNAFAVWKMPTSRKRTRFSGEYQYKHEKGKDGTRTAKLVKVY